MPCIARWPGILPAGKKNDRPYITMDLTASFARIGGAKLPEGRRFDGVDVLAEVTGARKPQPRMLFWRGRRADNTWKAVHDGDLKFVVEVKGTRSTEYLFDLQYDPSEKNNLASERPGEIKRMREILAKWETEVQPSR